MLAFLKQLMHSLMAVAPERIKYLAYQGTITPEYLPNKQGGDPVFRYVIRLVAEKGVFPQIDLTWTIKKPTIDKQQVVQTMLTALRAMDVHVHDWSTETLSDGVMILQVHTLREVTK